MLLKVRAPRALMYGLAAVPVWAMGGAGPWCSLITWGLVLGAGTQLGMGAALLGFLPAAAWGIWFGWTKDA